jgi:molybdate transport system regulatory protein
MNSPSKGDLRTQLRIDFPDSERLGPGKMQLLELIHSTGSISAAGRAMDMSYRRAWLLVSAMNAMFSTPVVDSQRGGKQGGGAVVTEFGEELLARYRSMQQKVDKVLDADFQWINANRSRS